MPFLTPNVPPDELTICRRIKLPAHTDWLSLVNGALAVLTKDYNFEQFGTATVAETVQFFEQFYLDYIDSTDYCMIGSIFPYMTTLPPANCLVCDGATYDRVDYPDLYAKLDSAFIVDADSFTVPDLRGKAPIGAGDGGADFTNRTVGETGGEEAHLLTVTELAAHNHTSPAHGHIDTGHSHSIPLLIDFPVVVPGEDPVGAQIVPIVSAQTGTSSANITDTTATIDATGDDTPHNNMQPFIALNYCVVAK